MNKITTLQSSVRKFIINVLRPLYGRGLGKYRVIAWLYPKIYQMVKPQHAMVINVQQHRMQINPDDTSLTPQLLMSGIYEPGVTWLWSRILKSGMTVVDIGANVGYHSLLMASYVGPTGHVYAFEPDPSNYQLLVKNIQLNSYLHIIPVEKGLGKQVEKAQLALHTTGRGANRLLIPGISFTHPRTISINVDTLDNFFTSVSCATIDVLKIDVEGLEYRVFQGAQAILKHNPRLILVVEFWPSGIRQYGDSAKDFLRDISNLGLRIFRIEGQNKLRLVSLHELDNTLLPGEISVNLFCCSNEILKKLQL